MIKVASDVLNKGFWRGVLTLIVSLMHIQFTLHNKKGTFSLLINEEVVFDCV